VQFIMPARDMTSRSPRSTAARWLKTFWSLSYSAMPRAHSPALRGHTPACFRPLKRDLPEMMSGGGFREDLYYRLNVVNIKMPPLNKRREDIPLLVARFLQNIAKEGVEERKVYAPEAVEMLVMAEWPGNVRQLFNIVRQNVALSRSPVISAEIVQQSLGQRAGQLMSFSDARDEFTRNYLAQILQITMGNVSQAARLAKRNRTDFYKLLARHELNPDQFKTR